MEQAGERALSIGDVLTRSPRTPTRRTSPPTSRTANASDLGGEARDAAANSPMLSEDQRSSSARVWPTAARAWPWRSRAEAGVIPADRARIWSTRGAGVARRSPVPRRSDGLELLERLPAAPAPAHRLARRRPELAAQLGVERTAVRARAPRARRRRSCTRPPARPPCARRRDAVRLELRLRLRRDPVGRPRRRVASCGCATSA